MRFVAEECVRLWREETTAPRGLGMGSETGPSADPSPVKGGAAGHKARPKAPAGRHLVVPSEDEAPAVPRSDAGGPPSGGTSATRAVYGGITSVMTSFGRVRPGWTSLTPNGTTLGTSSRGWSTIVWTYRCKGEGLGSALTGNKQGTTTLMSPCEFVRDLPPVNRAHERALYF
ncbi:hypothetical protein PanWU01x14_347520 [Parasponia andersonii]|uniref:Uncharacterized protein n=1 Tax=Parasponia andersonii TaxID=3476 RepID=A0A2P5ABY1_PARAD|nr:hypothetical protein PanWU01x14_347520 [Parasponia andersonii]